MFGRRITAILHRLDVRLECLEWRRVAGLKIPNEARRTPLGNVEDVVKDENLAIDVGSRANADDRDFE